MFNQDISFDTSDALKRLLKHSFEPIEWRYEHLTESEKECVTPEQFAQLKEWTINS